MSELTVEAQLNEWLEGRPRCPNLYGECCPDFSCCMPELLVSIEERQAFLKVFFEGDEFKKEQFLLTFLRTLFSRENTKAYLVGELPERKDA